MVVAPGVHLYAVIVARQRLALNENRRTQFSRESELGYFTSGESAGPRQSHR
jgi:hypothetical protein